MDEAEPPVEFTQPFHIQKALPAFVLTILIAGTLFLRAPQGLGGLADTLSAYLKTWITRMNEFTSMNSLLVLNGQSQKQ